MAGFWEELEAESKGVDLKKLAVQGSGEIPPIKDYYVRVEKWEFKRVGANDTPLCECKLRIIAPVDGIDIDEVAGLTIQQNLWLTQPKEKGKLGGIGMSLKVMSIMAGESIDSLSKIKTAELDSNIFKIVNNKLGEYNGVDKFDIGFSNALTASDYKDLEDMGVETGKSNAYDDGEPSYDSDDIAF